MLALPPPFRRATPGDAAALVDFVHFASEGLALHVWTKAAGADGDPWHVGRERACREAGSFSYRNAIVAVHEGRLVAGLIGYPLADHPEPADYANMPPMFVPLQQLEELAPGTWYVNVLASYPEHRSLGYGTALLRLADLLAVDSGKAGLSIIVSDANSGARRLYERNGYREIASRPMVKETWASDGTNWLLLTKALGAHQR